MPQIEHEIKLNLPPALLTKCQQMAAELSAPEAEIDPGRATTLLRTVNASLPTADRRAVLAVIGLRKEVAEAIEKTVQIGDQKGQFQAYVRALPPDLQAVYEKINARLEENDWDLSKLPPTEARLALRALGKKKEEKPPVETSVVKEKLQEEKVKIKQEIKEPKSLRHKAKDLLSSAKREIKKRAGAVNPQVEFEADNWPTVEKIIALSENQEFRTLTREQMRERTANFKKQFAEKIKEKLQSWEEAKARLEVKALEDNKQEAAKFLENIVRPKEKAFWQERDAILNEFLVEAFALAREASRRTIGLTHFDVQVLGAIALHESKVPEMKTGEGKTLTADLPLYLNALTGFGAHLATVNDYLAKVGAGWMGPAYDYLGLKVSVVTRQENLIFDPSVDTSEHLDPRLNHFREATKEEIYQSDIVYAEGDEFGFDYLRGMLPDKRLELGYCIVDEVDEILVDEARQPLVISETLSEVNKELYQKTTELTKQLKPTTPGAEEEGDYIFNEKEQTLILTEKGYEKAEKFFGIKLFSGMGDEKTFELSEEADDIVSYLLTCLKAKEFYRRDSEYVVKNGKVILINPQTGRLLPENVHASNGIHQALEAKEGVEISAEQIHVAAITRQNLYRKFGRLAGMTGTAQEVADLLYKVYRLDVVPIRPNTPSRLIAQKLILLKNKEVKLEAIVDEIAAKHEVGQPVLVGAMSPEKADELSLLLAEAGIPHQKLTAKNHEQEATMIAQAGRVGMVTISTQMAGRGVDIALGGDPNGLAMAKLKADKVNLEELPLEEKQKVWQKALLQTKKQCEKERKKVLAVGGLHIIDSELPESKRISRQLQGRAGRQGDPGSYCPFISPDDDLIRIYAAGDKISRLLEFVGMKENVYAEVNELLPVIQKLQERIEGSHNDRFIHLFEFDCVLDAQREIKNKLQRRIIAAESPTDLVRHFVNKYFNYLLEDAWKIATAQKELGFNWDNFWGKVIEKMPVIPTNDLKAKWQLQYGASAAKKDFKGLQQAMWEWFLEHRSIKIGQPLQVNFTPDGRVVEQFVYNFNSEKKLLFEVLNNNWVQYYSPRIDELLEGFPVRAVAGQEQNPLVSYRQQTHDLFEDFLRKVYEDTAYHLLNALLSQTQFQQVEFAEEKSQEETPANG